MKRGEEVWTTDKEARGRAERKQRYMDTRTGEEDVYKLETQIYKSTVVYEVRTCAISLCVKVCVYI